ncbi:hypothetical protein AB0C33_35415 [Nonomuraea sp. NPDC048881]|uniref:MmyB family transcriptional regulator n=1 Tax=Nonomuraea sp. NPDC048881 TaxID=3155030 RepID=UPI00340018BF
MAVGRRGDIRFPTDEGLNALVDELPALSLEFRAMWTEHPVSNRASISRDYRHPEVGVMTLTPSSPYRGVVSAAVRS